MTFDSVENHDVLDHQTKGLAAKQPAGQSHASLFEVATLWRGSNIQFLARSNPQEVQPEHLATDWLSKG